MKKKSIFKRIISLAAAGVMMLTANVAALEAAASEVSLNSPRNGVSASEIPHLNIPDSILSTVDGEKALKALNYAATGSYLVEGSALYQFELDDSDTLGLCVQPGKEVRTYDQYVEDGEKWDGSDYAGASTYWAKINSIKGAPYTLALISYYGYPNASENNAYFYASQLLMWEVVMGFRSPVTMQANNGKDTTTFANYTTRLRNYYVAPSDTSSDYYASKTAVQAAYDRIVSKVTSHSLFTSTLGEKPSEPKEYTLKYNSEKKRWENTITVGTKWVSDSNFVNQLKAAGYSVSTAVSGSNTVLTVYSAIKSGSANTIKVTKTSTATCADGTIGQMVLNTGTSQTLVKNAQADPVSGYLKLNYANTYDYTVNKTYYNSTTGTAITATALLRSGTAFKIYYTATNGSKYYVTATGSSGTYSFTGIATTAGAAAGTTFNLSSTTQFTIAGMPSGKYTLEETSTPAGFKKATSKTITIGSADVSSSVQNNTINTEHTTVALTKELNDTTTVEAQTYFQQGAISFLAYYIDGSGTRQYLLLDRTAGRNKLTNALYTGNGSAYTYNCRASTLTTDTGTSRQLNDAGTGYTTETYTGWLLASGHTTTRSSATVLYPYAYYFPSTSGTITTTTGADTYSSSFGKINLTNVPVDDEGEPLTVYFEEISTLTGWGYTGDTYSTSTYAPNGPIVFNDSDGDAELGNAPYFYQVQLTKSDDGSAPLAGAEYAITQYVRDATAADLAAAVTIDGTVYTSSAKAYVIRDDAVYKIIETQTTDEDGIASFSADLYNGESYYLLETIAPSGYLINANILDITQDAPASSTILPAARPIYAVSETDDLIPGQINIVKTDSVTAKPVSGAKFSVTTDQTIMYQGRTYTAGQIVATMTTDGQGKASVTGLPVGAGYANTYTVKEISVPAPYLLESDKLPVQFTSDNFNGTFAAVTLELTNTQMPIQVIIHKVSATNSGASLAGAVFTIIPMQDYLAADGTKLQTMMQPIATMTTDANGDANTLVGPDDETSPYNPTPLYFGVRYALVETKAPAGYVLTDADGNKVEQLIYYFQLDCDGGKYSVKVFDSDLEQVSDNPMYQKQFDFDLSSSDYMQTLFFRIKNTPSVGWIHLQKNFNMMYQPASTYQIPGLLTRQVSFTVEDKEGNYVVADGFAGVYTATGTTTDKTAATKFYLSSPNLNKATLDVFNLAADSETGTDYIVKEAGGPVTYDWEAASGGKSVTVTYSPTGQAAQVVITNTEKTGSIQVTKSTVGNRNIAGIRFNLAGTSDSGRAISDSAVTDTSGVATFNNIPIGTYTVTEDSATVPTAYLVADPETVTVTYAETTMLPISNDEKTGAVQVTKSTVGSQNIADIDFVLTGTSDSGREIELTATTDENGIATFANVPIGTYTVSEDGSSVPTAYLVADDQEVTVNYAQTSALTVSNAEKTGSIQVTKATTGNLNIAGIDFILSGTSDSGREIELTATTDENGIATFTGVPIGTYTVSEDGSTVPVAYLVADDREVNVIYAQTTALTVNNAEKTGSIQVTKSTTENKNIAAIDFILTGTSDSGREIELTATTDENGIASFANVPIGTYTVSEDGSSVPTAYLVADDQQVTVTYAETLNLPVFNQEKFGTIELTKTTVGNLNISDIRFILEGTSDSGRAIHEEIITDENGKGTFSVPIGTYTITEDESTVNVAYLVADPFTVDVFYSQSTRSASKMI
ncbi:MAG: SpaA isopeptide-forming pilin-related protein [Oscillospiraceae bacterium]